MIPPKIFKNPKPSQKNYLWHHPKNIWIWHSSSARPVRSREKGTSPAVHPEEWPAQPRGRRPAEPGFEKVYKLVYNPNNYRYNPLINPSYNTYKPT